MAKIHKTPAFPFTKGIFMDWKEIVITTTTEGIDAVSGALIMNGVSGYTVQDSRDFEDFLEEKTVYWDYIEESLMSLRSCVTTVTFYVSDDDEGEKTLCDVRHALASLKKEDKDGLFGELTLSEKVVADEDWANNWKQYFKPLLIGDSLVIKPSWEEYTENDGRKIIEIDPSSSFGTGSHTTTRLCLEYIEKLCSEISPIENMADIGCGSGILGIGAYLLGCDNITAVDIEDNSIKIAKENFAMNNIPDRKVRALVGSITDDKALYAEVSDRKYKLLAANIVADVLISMAPLFREMLAFDGYAVLSGIITEREEQVLDTFRENGFEVCDIKHEDCWTAALVKLI